MNDIPPSVAIVFMVCITIIVATIAVCDCVKQKYAAPDSVVSTTETTTDAGVTSAESATDTSTGR